MFKDVFDLSLQRNSRQAAEFYVAYLLMIVMSGAFTALVISLTPFVGPDFVRTSRIGLVLATLSVTTLTALLVKRKNLLGNFSYVLLIFLSAMLTAYGGAFLGLMLTTIISTKPVFVKK